MGVNPNHNDGWQLGLLLTVSEEAQATTIINLTLNHISNLFVRLHGHFGEGEIAEDGLFPMPKKQSFPLAVTVRRYNLELQMGHAEKAAAHRLGNIDGITTSTLELKNIVAAENFNVSRGCAEVNNSRTSKILKYAVQPRFSGTATTLDYSAHTTLPENNTIVIVAASCGAAALAMAATLVIYCASRRLRGTPPDNAASCSVQDEGPRPVQAQAQQDIRVHALSDNTYVNVATPAQEHSTAHATWVASGQMGMGSALCVDEHHSSPEEHIYESAGDIAVPMYTDYANYQERSFPEEHIYESASDKEEQTHTNCANYQERSFPEEHIYESAGDIAVPKYTDYANYQERSFPEEHIYDTASDKEEQTHTNCANYQQKCSLEEHIYESATDTEESSDSRSKRNSIYECERDTDSQQSLRNSIYADFT
ncbi:uncharacterized protein LOC134776791 [Penaeus indicus]|uniref:uncharacterized protein LOC134776791 n=1 Tax=Penaeus indicus TaxID=29960 RepID=UPI00300DB8B7